VALSHTISEWQSDNCKGVGNFTTKLVAMATFLKMSEKEGRIDHLQFTTYHMVQRLWKSVQRILRYFRSQRTSLLPYKIVCHGNVPWDIEKKFRSIIYAQNAFKWCKNFKNRTWFMFCLRHKIGCHGNVPWGIGKSGPDQENPRKYLPFGEKIVIIGPVVTELALLRLKKEEINTSKIYSPVGNLAVWAKN